jgi:hypothetical protein
VLEKLRGFAVTGLQPVRGAGQVEALRFVRPPSRSHGLQTRVTIGARSASRTPTHRVKPVASRSPASRRARIKWPRPGLVLRVGGGVVVAGADVLAEVGDDRAAHRAGGGAGTVSTSRAASRASPGGAAIVRLSGGIRRSPAAGAMPAPSRGATAFLVLRIHPWHHIGLRFVTLVIGSSAETYYTIPGSPQSPPVPGQLPASIKPLLTGCDRDDAGARQGWPARPAG